MPLSTAAILAASQDSAGMYLKVDIGTTVDNVFVFSDGTNKFQIIDTSGPYIARLGGILPGSNMTTALQTILSHASVKEVVFDSGDITITGALSVPTGKKLTFRNQGALTGAGSVTGGIIDAGEHANIFKSTLTVRPAGVSNSRGSVSVKWFGATGNGSTDDYTSCQRAIDCVIYSTSLSKLFFPVGIYRVTKGLLIRKDTNGDGTADFAGPMDIEGVSTTYGSATSESRIFIDNVDSFGLGIHRGKGIRVRNICVMGKNSALAGLTTYQVWEDPATNWTNGCRSNLYSPHACFIVDPFARLASAPNQYPDFPTMYTDNQNGGSTDIIFENCKALYGVVGYCMSPHNSPQNGDNLHVMESWGDYCDSAYSCGQSQNRSNRITNFKCWGGTRVVINATDYTDGTADYPEVDGLQIAGSVRYVCTLGTWGGTKGLQISKMHCESAASLGGFLGSGIPSGNLQITDSWVHLQYADTSGGTHFKSHVFKGASLEMRNSFFGYYSGGVIDQPMVISSTSALFDNVSFEHIPISNRAFQGTPISFKFRDCKYGLSVNGFGHDFVNAGKRPLEVYNNFQAFIGSSKWQTTRYGAYSTTAVALASYVKECVPINVITGSHKFQDSVYGIPVQTASATVSNVNTSAQTADITLTAASEGVKKLRVGDYLITVGTDDSGEATQLVILGKVTAKVNATGVVSLGYTKKGLTAGAITSGFFTVRVPFLIPEYILGDTTSGSAVVSNCLGENAFIGIPNPAVAGITVNSPYFPIGTYIVSLVGTTLTLSNEANATVTSAEIIGQGWKGTQYGGTPIPASPQGHGWRLGDEIVNTDQVTYPNIVKWVCSRRGIENSGFNPQFRTIYSTNVPQFASDGAADTAGEIYYYNTVTNRHKIKDNATWFTIPESNLASADQAITAARAITLSTFDLTIDASSSGDLKINLGSDATGDTLYRDASGDIARLALGTSNQRLGNNGTIPVWKDIAKTTTLASVDGSLAIAADTLVTHIMVEPTSATAAFSIGTTSGGADIVPAQPIGSGVQVFTINWYYKNAGNLWFNGITSSTAIKAYIET